MAQTLALSLKLLAEVAGVELARQSRWYTTPAVPPGAGADFVNGAAAIETSLGPYALLAALHGIEARLGRQRPSRWVPRVCDLDLIAMEDLVLPDRATLARWMALDLGTAQSVEPPRLILPHPRMHERGFVLVPLAEIAPFWRHPATDLTVTEMRDALPPPALAGICPLE